jgi:hypothetical protein
MGPVERSRGRKAHALHHDEFRFAYLRAACGRLLESSAKATSASLQYNALKTGEFELK